jgi:hypothetical protein
MRSDVPGSAGEATATATSASVDNGARGDSDRPPRGYIDFDVTIGPGDDEGNTPVAYKFASCDDSRAYHDGIVQRGVGALALLAMNRNAEVPPAVEPARAAESTPAVTEGHADLSRSDVPAPKFMRVKTYAARTGYSQRTIENFMTDGLPTVGEHRLRRVDVELADEWIRNRAARDQGEQDDFEREVRDDARHEGARRRHRRV